MKINAFSDYENYNFVYKVNVEVTNNGGDGWVRVYTEKKQYETTETLDYRLYLENKESKYLTFIFSTDPYVSILPSYPTSTPQPTYTPTPLPTSTSSTPIPVPSPTGSPAPITSRVWAEAEQ